MRGIEFNISNVYCCVEASVGAAGGAGLLQVASRSCDPGARTCSRCAANIVATAVRVLYIVFQVLFVFLIGTVDMELESERMNRSIRFDSIVALSSTERETAAELERSRALQELRKRMESERLRDLDVAKRKQWVFNYDAASHCNCR